MITSSRIPSPFTTIIGSQDSSLSFASAQAAELGIELIPKYGEGKRQAQFQLGRLAATKAFRQLGFREPVEIPREESGKPTWPDQVTGSISHTSSYAIAAIASRAITDGVGVDIELETSSRSLAVYARTLGPAENAFILSMGAEALSFALDVFSLKESLYKAFFEASGEALHYQEMECRFVEENLASRHYEIGILRDIRLKTGNLVLTGYSQRGDVLRWQDENNCAFVISGVLLPLHK